MVIILVWSAGVGQGEEGGQTLGREEGGEKNSSCSRMNSYFDPSVGSDWASLMSICLAGISVAPGNPTGFLGVDGI